MKRTLQVVAVTAVIFAIIALVVAIRGTSSRDAASTIVTGTTLGSPNVVYLVDGSASSASLTYSTPTGESQVDVMLPLTNKQGDAGFTFTFEPGSTLYLSAQNDGDAGAVTCHIWVDGVQVSENTGDGGYQIATCQGTS